MKKFFEKLRQFRTFRKCDFVVYTMLLDGRFVTVYQGDDEMMKALAKALAKYAGSWHGAWTTNHK